MTMQLREAAGSLLVVGLEGIELTSLERAWLKLIRPAGTILFRRNIESATQTRALLKDASHYCAQDNLRCVDVEGGTVDRLRNALAPLPSAQAVYNAATNARKPAWMYEHGVLAARAVKAFGFNTTLAPVLDLALPASAEVMGTRAAAPTATGVVDYARNFLAGLRSEGIVGCGKHFPGLGAGAVDSHALTPSIERTLRQLKNEDLVPYRELRKELPMVMVNHAAYPLTQSKDKPATASPYWVSNVLRKQIGYRGLAFSDDLEMGGILKYMPIEEAVIASIRAGMDLMEICHSADLILRAYESLLSEAEHSKSFRTILLQRAKYSQRQRAKLFSHEISKPLTEKQFATLRSRIEHFSETIRTAQEG